MKAISYNEFQGQINFSALVDPVPSPTGAVIKVVSTGLCRSDWHGWMGHDPDIAAFPHVPGHEFSGVIEAVGKQVSMFKPGQRVTVPFVCGCGVCRECVSGNQQVCDHQFQPGFSGWGSFAEYVAIEFADVNLVELPESMDFATAASLGCRFTTAFRAVVAQGRVQADQWVVIYGCGGVGLAAIMIARAKDAKVIAIDINDDSLELARQFGAVHTINASQTEQIVQQVMSITSGGAHLSVDAVGSTDACVNGISSLKKRGRHVQVGLMTAAHAQPPIPMGKVIAGELEVVGSHGMQAHKFSQVLEMIEQGRLAPQQLIRKTIGLKDVVLQLPAMSELQGAGITMIDLEL